MVRKGFVEAELLLIKQLVKGDQVIDVVRLESGAEKHRSIKKVRGVEDNHSPSEFA